MSRRSASLTLALSLSPWAAFAQLAPVRVGAEFQVNAYTSANQRVGGVAVMAGGKFVVTWSSAGQDGSGLGVFAQRFAPDLIFRDGFQ